MIQWQAAPQSARRMLFSTHSTRLMHGLWGLAAALVALGCCMGLARIFSLHAAVNQVLRPLQAGDLAAAQAAHEAYGAAGQPRRLMVLRLSHGLQLLVSDVQADRLAQDTAWRQWRVYRALGLPELAAQVDQAQGRLSALYASHSAYEAGMTYLKEGNHARAIQALRQVLPEDVHAASAGQELQRACDNLRRGALSRAQMLYEAGDVQAALAALRGALEVLPGDEALLERQRAYAAAP